MISNVWRQMTHRYRCGYWNKFSMTVLPSCVCVWCSSVWLEIQGALVCTSFIIIYTKLSNFLWIVIDLIWCAHVIDWQVEGDVGSGVVKESGKLSAITPDWHRWTVKTYRKILCVAGFVLLLQLLHSAWDSTNRIYTVLSTTRCPRILNHTFKKLGELDATAKMHTVTFFSIVRYDDYV